MEQEQIEAVDPEPLEAAFCRHPQVGGVPVRPTQARIGETGEPARPVPLALVEVMAERAHEAVRVARKALERRSKQAVGLSGAVDVGRDDGRDVGAGAQQGRQALVVQRLAEMHETSAAPGAERDVAGVGHSARC